MPRKKQKKKFVFSKSFNIILILAAIVAVFLFINHFNPWILDESPRIKMLQTIEVREYQGENLSSIADFRENSIRGPQYIDRDEYRLKIKGLVENNKEYTYDEVLDRQKYKKVVELQCIEGWSANILWEGILIRELLEEADPLETAKSVVFHAEDGYTSGLPLEYFYDNDIIMAYKMNEVEIPPERGFPFQLIAQSKYGYKWVKWITEIELTDRTDYKGYWESRGFNNKADVK